MPEIWEIRHNLEKKLKDYFVTKNAPERGEKKGELDDIKMEIYNSYLNQDFGDERERPPNVSAKESKVMKEFFREVDKYEEKYISDEGDISYSEMSTEPTAMMCGLKFIRDCGERLQVLLKEDIRD